MYHYFYRTIALSLYILSPEARCVLWTSWQVRKQTIPTAQTFFEISDKTPYSEESNARYQKSLKFTETLCLAARREVPVTTSSISSVLLYKSKLICLFIFVLSAASGSFQRGVISPVRGGNSHFACLLKPPLFSSCSSQSVTKTTPRLGCSRWTPASAIPSIEDSLYAGISKVVFSRQKKEVPLSCF